MTNYDMSNIVKKIQQEEMGQKTPSQYLYDLLRSQHLQQWESEKFSDSNGKIIHLMFAHKQSLDLYRKNPNVLVIDCTYKTNHFNMPLCHFVTQTSTGRTIGLAYCFMSNERKESYRFVLTTFLKWVGFQPRLVMTDKEQALGNAISIVYPEAIHQYCKLHIDRNFGQQMTAKWKSVDSRDASRKADYCKRFHGLLFSIHDKTDFLAEFVKISHEFKDQPDWQILVF